MRTLKNNIIAIKGVIKGKHDIITIKGVIRGK